MRFYCCHCGLPIGCDDSLAGTQANCPDCQAPLTIPYPFVETAESFAAVEEVPEIPDEAVEPAYQMAPPPFVPGPEQAAIEMPLSPPASPAASRRRPKGRFADRVSCAFVGLILVFCLLMGVSGLRLSLLSIGSRFQPGAYVPIYFVVGVVFIAVGSLVMRSYRHAHRLYLRQSLADYRGAFRFRRKPTEGRSGLFMGAGILCSIVSIIPIPVLGSFPVMLLAAVAFAAAFDVGQQRKLLKKLRKEQGNAAPDPIPQEEAAPEVPEWTGQEAELADLLEPHSLPSSPPARWGLRAIGLLSAVFVLLLLLVSQPWPHYQWASLSDKVKSYEFFLDRFPDGSLSDRARVKLRGLKDEETWSNVQAQHSLGDARGYLRDYPDGSHCGEAREMIAELIDQEFKLLIDDSSKEPEIRRFLKIYPEASPKVLAKAEALLAKISADDYRRLAAKRSAKEIREYLESHPDSPHRAAIELELGKLYDDLEWVKEQDSLEHYRRFISSFPRHPSKEWIEKRIIDLEVAEIAAGEHGELPSTAPQSLGGTEVEIEVKNDTGYPLTLRYSGPDSKMLVISVGESGKASLLPGKYQVAGSVAGSSARNYYGTETLEGGIYAWNFFISYEPEIR